MNKCWLVSIIAVILFGCQEPAMTKTQLAEQQHSVDSSLVEYGKRAKSFCCQHSMNTDFCFLIDMSIPSGRPRFFVVNLKDFTRVDSGLVSHGCGPHPWGWDVSKEDPTFSNEPDSHCSSIGKYKIGKRGVSSWGIKVNYVLHGLDKSNSRALERQIVLHSWDRIPKEAVYPAGVAEGWGCPAVNDEFMRRLDQRLQNSEKPVLLWIYQGK
jgi:hypothetical protein